MKYSTSNSGDTARALHRAIVLTTTMAMGLIMVTACGKTDSTSNNETTATSQQEATDVTEKTSGTANIFNYSQMEGSYSDTYSERAMMTVTAGSDCLQIEVDWSSSWCEYTRWTMTATYDADTNRFVYTDETREDIASDDAEGGAKDDVVYQGESGYFEWNADTQELSWTGAHDESCRDCIFAKDNYESTDDTAVTSDTSAADAALDTFDADSIVGASYDSIQEEIDAVAAASQPLEETMYGDYPQQTLNQAAYAYSELWDAELNSLWSRLSKELDADTKATTLEEQRTWIKNTDAAVEEAGADWEGGTMQGLIEGTTRGDLTKARVYEFAKLLADTRGESFVEP